MRIALVGAVALLAASLIALTGVLPSRAPLRSVRPNAPDSSFQQSTSESRLSRRECDHLEWDNAMPINTSQMEPVPRECQGG